MTFGPYPSRAVLVSWREDDDVVRLTSPAVSPDNQFMISREQVLRLYKDLEALLNHMGVIPTQEEFDQYRDRILKDMP